MNFKLILILSFSFFCNVTLAQPPTHTIKVLSHVKPDRVWLRWAPTDFTVWQLGNKYGYTIERFTVASDGTLTSQTPMVLHTGIKPLSKAEFDNLAKTTEEATIIQELIYGEEESANNSGPSAILQKQDDLNNRFGMVLLVCDLAPAVAEAAGLFLSDSTAVKGSRYIYKISIANKELKVNVEPGVIVVDVVEAKPLQPFTDLKENFSDRTVTLTWPTLLHRGIYSAYHIEKYDEIDKKFKSITDLPYIPMSESTAHTEEAHFVDSLANNTTTYQYRVKGITPFGEVGPPSNIVKGIGKDNLAKLIVLTNAKPEKNKIALEWEFPAEYENKIGGFIIGRSGKAGGPFKDVNTKALSPKTRQFSDAIPTYSSYYQIKAIDSKGKELSHSFPYFVHVEDNIVPGTPAGLTGSVDSTGLVTLTWKDNIDEDLLGYRLFSSNDARHEFVEITREIITTPTFRDTINISVLNRDIFYKIVAVDQNYNTSNYSNYIKLKRPDIINPVAPVFSKVDLNKTEVSLSWVNSTSKDVAKHVLYRTENDYLNATEILSWPVNQPKTSYVDNALVLGKAYRYVIKAFDSTGNYSIANSKEIRFESGLRTAVTELTASINRENKTITLRWNYDEPVMKSILYRRKNNEPFTLYQSLEGPTLEFSDNQVMINNTYSYKIQLILKNKIKTELSKELKVPF
jgi:fibronectin type 3 domain-containing protein